MEVTGQVQVEFFGRHDLRVATTSGTTLDAEHRAHRRLSDHAAGALADAIERLAYADGVHRLAFTKRRRRDRHDDDVLALLLGRLLQAVKFDLRLGMAVWL